MVTARNLHVRFYLHQGTFSRRDGTTGRGMPGSDARENPVQVRQADRLS